MDNSESTLELEKQKTRLRFSNDACTRLLSIYESGVIKPNKALREQLGQELDKTPRSIQIWFQNKRAKAKAKKPNQNDEETTKKRNLPPLDMNILKKNCGPLTADLNSALSPISTSTPLRQNQIDDLQNIYSRPVAPLSYVGKRSEIINNFPQEFSTIFMEKTPPFPNYYNKTQPLTPISPLNLNKLDTQNAIMNPSLFAARNSAEFAYSACSTSSIENFLPEFQSSPPIVFGPLSDFNNDLPSSDIFGHMGLQDYNINNQSSNEIFGQLTPTAIASTHSTKVDDPPEECFTDPKLFMQWVNT